MELAYFINIVDKSEYSLSIYYMCTTVKCKLQVWGNSRLELTFLLENICNSLLLCVCVHDREGENTRTSTTVLL